MGLKLKGRTQGLKTKDATKGVGKGNWNKLVELDVSRRVELERRKEVVDEIEGKEAKNFNKNYKIS